MTRESLFVSREGGREGERERGREGEWEGGREKRAVCALSLTPSRTTTNREVTPANASALPIRRAVGEKSALSDLEAKA